MLRRGSTLLVVIVLLIVGAAVIGGIAYFSLRGKAEPTDGPILHEVTRGPYDHIVLEQGEVESSSNVEIRCEVKARSPGGTGASTTIIWVIEEGKLVEKDEVVCKLDSSALEQEAQTQQIAVNTSDAKVVQAKSLYDQAIIAREEYLQGTYLQEEQTIANEITIAEENERRAEEYLKYSELLAVKGYVTPLQLEGDRFAVQKSRIERELAEGKMRVLKELTKKKMLIQFDSDIVATETQWKNEQKSLAVELQKLKDVETQIEKCTMRAPAAGQVVYANVTSNRGGQSEFVVEAGSAVRENQVLIKLPDPALMQIKATISESRVTLVAPGMPVNIRIDAFGNKTLKGRVTRVNKYPEPGSWFSSQVKEFATFIQILDPPPEIRSGMTAEVNIYVERQSNALQIPVQAVYELKGHTFALVKKGPRQWETREIEFSSTNDKFVSITKGLEAGEKVAMNPRNYRDLMQLPDLPDPAPDAEVKAVAGDSASGSGPGGRPGSAALGAGPAGAPGGGAPGGGAPGGGAPGGGAPGGGAPGGGAPGGGRPNPDTNGDGILSAEELQSIPAQFRERMLAADANGDGSLDATELTAMRSRFQAGGAPGAAPGGAPGGAPAGSPGGGGAAP